MPTVEPIRLPHPVYEAQVLLTICDDDVAQARIEARQNYRRAETDNEAAFWFGVLEALRVSARPQA
jgi:hypothetical protein